MLSVRARLSYTLNKRTFATVTEAARKQPSVDQKFKVVVVGGGPGGLSGNFENETTVYQVPNCIPSIRLFTL